MGLRSTLVNVFTKLFLILPFTAIGSLVILVAFGLSFTALSLTSAASLLSALILPHYLESSAVSAGLVFGSIFAAVLSFCSFLFFAAFFVFYLRLSLKTLVKKI